MNLQALTKLLCFGLLTTVSSVAASSPVSFGDVVGLKTSKNLLSSERYGATSLHTLVRSYPHDETATVVLLIHGGCWSNAFDRDHSLPMAEALSTVGYDVWVPE